MRITDLLRTIDLFARLPADDLDHLSHRMRERHLDQDEVLCHQGEPAQAMIIVTAGRIKLSAAEADGRMRTVRELAEGDFFGEIALFARERHTATATAVDESRVLVLEQDEFEALVASDVDGATSSSSAASSNRRSRSRRPTRPGMSSARPIARFTASVVLPAPPRGENTGCTRPLADTVALVA